MTAITPVLLWFGVFEPLRLDFKFRSIHMALKLPKSEFSIDSENSRSY